MRGRMGGWGNKGVDEVMKAKKGGWRDEGWME